MDTQMLLSKSVKAISDSAKSKLNFPFQLLPLLLAALLLWAPGIIRAQSSAPLTPGPKPADIPQPWKPWIGDYGTDEVSFTVGESEGHLFILDSVPSRNPDHGKKWDLPEAPIEKPVTAELTDKTIFVINFHRDATGKQVLLTNDLGWSKKT